MISADETQFIPLHPEFTVELHDLDAMNQDAASKLAARQKVVALPLIRFFHNTKLIGESSCVLWSERCLEKWVQTCLADERFLNHHSAQSDS